jgi:dienelactone hydrolase
MKRTRLAQLSFIVILAALCGLLVAQPAAAELKLDISAPAGAQELPVVLIVQGTGTVGSREAGWARWFNERGLAAVVIHSAAARGLRNFAGSHIEDYSEDIPVTLAQLAGDPRLDTTRFALIGFSRGGSVVLMAGKLYGDKPVRPALVFAFYPGTPGRCANEHDAQTEVHIFNGLADEWALHHGLLGLCRSSQAGNLRIHEFPGAHHGFDDTKSMSFRSGATGSREFHLLPNPEATAEARETIAEALTRVWGEFKKPAGK